MHRRRHGLTGSRPTDDGSRNRHLNLARSGPYRLAVTPKMSIIYLMSNRRRPHRTRTLHDARSNSQHRRTPQSPPSQTRRPTRLHAAAIAAGTARRHATQETTP
ncbi:hypothetical protein Y047_5333 [Burkholderia pseudomallei MSHR3016]|nr:hypothetical protein Y047_5333 [Burkholderia pseudomallei MSHR3016]